MKLVSAIARHPLWSVLVASALFGTGSAWLLQGSDVAIVQFVCASLFAGAGALIGLLCLPASLACSLASHERLRRRAPVLLGTAMGGLIVAVVAAGSVFLSATIGRALEQSARNWAVALVPAIEGYREQHGTYPGALSEVVDLSQVPRLVRHGDLVYSGDGHDFSFDMKRGWLSGWYWHSSGREWHYYN
jgi:hypothetical protein